MQNVSFTPRQRPVTDRDVIADRLAKMARTIFVVVLGLSPLFFIPITYTPFNFSKVLFVILGVFLALIFYSLATLRQGKLVLPYSAGIISMWVLTTVTFLAAAFSGDIQDSIFGDDFGIQTAVFVAFLALIATVAGILREQKSSVMQVYVLLTGGGVVIGLYHVTRLMFGPDTLSFNVMNSATSSVLGGWNDLALFFGLALLLALLAVEQFPLTKMGKVLFGVVSLLSLIILAVVNFFAIWVVLGLVSLIVLMYSLTKNRFQESRSSDDDSGNTMLSVVFSVVVFIVSMVFVAGGSAVGQMVSDATGISYVEVRPSFEATLDITRSVYQENMFFGIGPNKFTDAWRQYKDPAINQTIFWNTPFQSGVGYIPTFASTMGIVGIIAWVTFFFFLLRAGIQVLFTRTPVDKFWYFVGASSFISGLYLWGMSIIYVPGPAILILAAFFTGILFATQRVVAPPKVAVLSVVDDHRHGFALVAVAIIVIVGSVSALYYTGRQYTSLLTFNKALTSAQDGTPIEEIESQISNSYTLYNNDRFAREVAGLQLQKMNSMLALTEPTEAQRQQFQSIVANGVNAAQLAVDADPTDPRNHQILGNIYSILAGSGTEGAEERSRAAFERALIYDPSNPEIKLQLAQLESRVGNLEAASTYADEAISLKPDYTSAYLFVAQIAIALGNVEEAIQATRASVMLEPRNPARYYQLGVLYSSQNQMTEAIESLEAAITLNEDYANALYFLARAYDAQGRTDDARAQLERVLELNPGNANVTELLNRIDRGESLNLTTETPQQVSEAQAEIGEDGEVLTPIDPGSSLLSPVNTVPSDSEEASAVFESEMESEESESANESTAANGTEESVE